MTVFIYGAASVVSGLAALASTGVERPLYGLLAVAWLALAMWEQDHR